MVKEGLFYTKDHEWAKIDGDTATMGITHYAQEQLGEVVFVELPEIGKEIAQKGELAAVESSKAASDVYSPVKGKVTKVNSELESSPEKINEDCYDSGWICTIEITDKSTISNLMDAKQYEAYLNGL
jgi:glycine cleavage system H protein